MRGLISRSISNFTCLFIETTKKVDVRKNRAESVEIDKDHPWICPFKIWDRNTAFPPLADALEITYDDQVGRHVKATRNIKAGRLYFLQKNSNHLNMLSRQYQNILIQCLMFISGETINIEEAIAAHLSPYKMKTNCIHCFRKTGSSVFPSPVNRFVTLITRNKYIRKYYQFPYTMFIIF